ncbi:MAG: AmmeMemoRadiSam system radical SAM enzyme [Candidatus Bathyarchaeia archaeon]
MEGLMEARFYDVTGDKLVKCNLCSHRCVIQPSKKGVCAVRENRDGRLYTLVYGRLIARAVDPVEKKPLFHFYPGSKAYSIATVGCNFRCKNCQNYDISQLPRETSRVVGDRIAPEEVVEDAKRHGCRSIAYTYTEPTIFYEYAYDVAKLASREGIKNIFVTNGYITEEALRGIKPYLDAANIDLKSFNDSFYRRICGARLEPVLEAIKLYRELGIWIEITTLIIPGLNDSEEELRRIASFIKEELDPGVPWHVSRFYPMYMLLDLPQTPLETIHKARRIGLEAGLHYVYEGNVPGEGEHTICPGCGETLIKRVGYHVLENKLMDSSCPRCGLKVEGHWR